MPEEFVPKYEHFQDRLVREAIERGEFDGLEGAGKPLKMRHLGDPDWWIKDKIERERIADDVRALERERARRRMRRPH